MERLPQNAAMERLPQNAAMERLPQNAAMEKLSQDAAVQRLHCKNVRVISTLPGLSQLHLFRFFYNDFLI